MNITMEMIDQLRERKNVSYSEAKKALENANGDMVNAIIYLENNTSPKKEASQRFGSKLSAFIKKLNTMKVDIKKENALSLRLPVLITALLTVFLLPIIILVAIIYIALGYKITLTQSEDTSDLQLQETTS